ncbi:uncharacterized protein [Euphorbia lathyris]|uniref:uncharacterized protein n=1 Tax=Euphorbia lathyris TaxID=212925 RepID=UPI0033133D73
MGTQGFFSKLFDPQLPQKNPLHLRSSSSSSSSSWVDVDTGVSDLLASFALPENCETTLPYDPFVQTETESEKNKKKTSEIENEKPQKTYPPPITSLKLFNKAKGKREGGRLKLYFTVSDHHGEGEGEEEEEEHREEEEHQDEDEN